MTTAPVATQNPAPVPPACPSPPVSGRLILGLEAHAAAEAHDIAECQRLLDQTTDPAARLLLSVVLEAEQRHRTLLQRMVQHLREEGELTPSLTLLPLPPDAPGPDSEAAAVSLRALIRDAHEGARYLRHLARAEPGVHDGLYAVLLETVARDGEKHAYVLRYLLRRLEAQAGHPPAAHDGACRL